MLAETKTWADPPTGVLGLGCQVCWDVEHIHSTVEVETLTTREAQTALVIARRLAPRALQLQLLVQLVQAALIVVVVLQIPDWRPAVLPQILLIILMQRLQALEWELTNKVVIDAKVRHAPLGQLMCVVQLGKEV